MSASEERRMPFFVGLNRVMVSLGPLPDGRHCPYKCAFCYVDNGFSRYKSLSPDEIVQFVRSCTEHFETIYVSGDTDSFGPPRASIGIELIKKLSLLGVDLMFTTRSVLDNDQLDEVGEISETLRRSGRLLFACASIPRLHSGRYLESGNTPSPEKRIAFLKALKSRNVVTMLAIRPFLPIIPIQEYFEILSMCEECTDAVLGENWYVDTAGKIEQQVFRGPTPSNIEFVLRKMDFDTNTRWWKVWEGDHVRDAIKERCAQLGLPFFMRSQFAVDYIKGLQKPF